MLADPRCSTQRWAFVAGTTATFGMLRMVDFVTGGRATIALFRSRAEAETWILGGASHPTHPRAASS